MNPCKCPKCLERVNGPPTYIEWVIKFREGIASGRIQHIGDNKDGEPIYREL